MAEQYADQWQLNMRMLPETVPKLVNELHPFVKKPAGIINVKHSFSVVQLLTTVSCLNKLLKFQVA